jgi:predicted DNA-binding ArsR family transcriptional regulator
MEPPEAYSLAELEHRITKELAEEIVHKKADKLVDLVELHRSMVEVVVSTLEVRPVFVRDIIKNRAKVAYIMFEVMAIDVIEEGLNYKQAEALSL